MLKRPHYIGLGLVVLLTLIMLNLPNRTTARLKQGIGSLFAPPVGLISSGRQLAGEAVDGAMPRSELVRQLELLRQQNQELRLQAAQNENALRENDRLRQLLGWQQRPHRGTYKLARVVLHEPSNWWRTIQLDLGTRDGLSNNLPVLGPDGTLVGRISSASLTRSQVVLLGDPNCKVAARAENPGRDNGVISGSRPLESEFVEMGYLSRNADLKPGQNVWTSGLGGVFPKDILIGKIVEAHAEEYGLYTVARVRLAANLNALEEVWVMLQP